MALSPDLLPVSAACVGLVSKRPRLAMRATITLWVGLGLAVVSAGILTWLLKTFELLPASFNSQRDLGAIPSVNNETIIVALVAGIAAMLAFETRAGQAVGVAISVTTIPAAAYAGVAFALGDHTHAIGSLKVLFANVVMLLVGGTITLLVQRLLRPAPPAEVSGSPP